MYPTERQSAGFFYIKPWEWSLDLSRTHIGPTYKTHIVIEKKIPVRIRRLAYKKACQRSGSHSRIFSHKPSWVKIAQDIHIVHEETGLHVKKTRSPFDASSRLQRLCRGPSGVRNIFSGDVNMRAEIPIVPDVVFHHIGKMEHVDHKIIDAGRL